VKKVFVLGSDKIGWSVDKDREYTIKAIDNLCDYEVTKNIFSADIIFAVWCSSLLTFRFSFFNIFFKKKIIAVITSDLDHQKGEAHKVAKLAKVFVYANSHQKKQLASIGVSLSNMFFNPFYVDESVFRKNDLNREELCNKLQLDIKLLKDRFLIGSFQRDSLGSDLTKPKWQKNPDLLVDIFKKLDSKKILLIIAGPRRHYLINLCRNFKIDYVFLGDKKYIDDGVDDLKINALSLEVMPYLYNLIDLYLVTSKSEGGPKAIPESILCETRVLSTDVGFARDLLDDEFIYSDVLDAVNKINNFLSIKINENQSNISDYYTFSAFSNRISCILKGV
jgi:glycosyltransferase involved in cell wall biosynthesis